MGEEPPPHCGPTVKYQPWGKRLLHILCALGGNILNLGHCALSSTVPDAITRLPLDISTVSTTTIYILPGNPERDTNSWCVKAGCLHEISVPAPLCSVEEICMGPWIRVFPLIRIMPSKATTCAICSGTHSQTYPSTLRHHQSIAPDRNQLISPTRH